MAIQDRHVANALNVGIDYKYLLSAKQQQEQIDRQKRIDKENKTAQMMAGLKFPGNYNKYDDNLIRQNTENKINELIKFTSEHGDFSTDPSLMYEFLKIKNDIVQNPDVQRGERVKGEYESYVKWKNSPVNAHMLESDEVKRIDQQFANYVEYGDMNGALGGAGEFKFQNPALKHTLAKEFKDYANGIIKSKTTILDNDHYLLEATPEDIMKATESWINQDNSMSRQNRSEYNQAVIDGKTDESYKDWTYGRIASLTNSQPLSKPKNYNFNNGGGGNSDNYPKPYREIFSGNSQGNSETNNLIKSNHLSQDKGYVVTSNKPAVIYNVNGNQVPLRTTLNKKYEIVTGNSEPILNLSASARDHLQNIINPQTGEKWTQNDIDKYISKNGKISTNAVKDLLFEIQKEYNFSEIKMDELKSVSYSYKIAIPLDKDNPNFDMDLLEELGSKSINKLYDDNNFVAKFFYGNYDDPEDILAQTGLPKSQIDFSNNYNFKDKSSGRALLLTVYMNENFNKFDESKVDKSYKKDFDPRNSNLVNTNIDGNPVILDQNTLNVYTPNGILIGNLNE